MDVELSEQNYVSAPECTDLLCDVLLMAFCFAYEAGCNQPYINDKLLLVFVRILVLRINYFREVE